jgi:outer membrane protein assembly factor BamB
VPTLPRRAIVLPATALALFLLWAGAQPGRAAGPDWPQWGRDPGHNGAAVVAGQSLTTVLADFVYDPFVDAEVGESNGDLLAHYPVPLLDGKDVYMESKTGRYVSCVPPGSGSPSPCGADAWGSQVWNVQKLRWQGSVLVPQWRFESDWKPVPDGGHLNGWEPVFHPVLAGGFLYVPGAGGSVFRVDRLTGSGTRISPFGGGPPDPGTFVAGGLAADSAGNVYFNAMALDPVLPWSHDALGAWLVRIRPDGSSHKVAFSSLVPGAPAAFGACEGSFASDLPWPPGPSATPPSVFCGSQRPGLNVVPAIAADGTIYTVSRAHFLDRYGYIVAVDPSLTPRWAASLRDRLHDGCDVLVPPTGTPGGCRAGTTPGVDPATNSSPAGRVSDNGTSSPVALPGGGVLYGAFTRYNFDRGHLMHFDASGAFIGAYDFGWDITPAVWSHDGRDSILLKDNHYEVGSYCGTSADCPAEPGRYDVVSLDASLEPEWRFRSTNTESCLRGSGGITCVSDHPSGFEWCINQPAVGADGTVYANSEDGFLYAIGSDGVLREKMFLNLALGAAYTPLSIGGDGIIYTQNDGHLFAVGVPPRPVIVAPHRRRAPRALTSHRP